MEMGPWGDGEGEAPVTASSVVLRRGNRLELGGLICLTGDASAMLGVQSGACVMLLVPVSGT